MKTQGEEAKRAAEGDERDYGKSNSPGAHCVRQTTAAYELRRPRRPAADSAEHALEKNARREARIAALTRSSGIWHGEAALARDGLVYQKALRAEWR
ncbi:MAG: hypothetical protein JWP59_4164 [Massilia sp.]|jgi:hypothetical protein|nr:hypothetical protein [Massilia sp.]